MRDNTKNELTQDDIKYLESFIDAIDPENKIFEGTKEIIKEKKKIMFYKEDIKSNKNKD